MKKITFLHGKLLACLVLSFLMLPSAHIFAVPEGIPTAGLVASYDFDTDGKAEDSISGSDSVIHNAQWQEGTYRFNRGTTSYIDIGTGVSEKLAGAEAVTISLWFKSEGSPSNSYYMVMLPIDAGKNGLEMFINPTALRVAGRSQASDSWLSKKYPYPEEGRWTHVTAIWDYKTKEILCYVNGEEQKHDGGDAKAAFGADKYTPGSPNAGSISSKNTQNDFNGNLDEIRIYNRRLTVDEIKQLGATKELDTSLTASEITEVLDQKLSGAVVLALDCTDAFVNKTREKIDPDSFETAPLLQNARTLIPLRFVGEAFGAEVSFDEGSATATVQKEGVTITAAAGGDALTVNGVRTPLDVEAQLIGGRMMLPLRAVGEALGKEVFYHDGLIVLSDAPLFDVTVKDDLDCVTELKSRLVNLRYIPPVRNHKATEVTVDYSDPATSLYIASPSIVKLPDGSMMASHDFNGPKNDMSSIVFLSEDGGKTWQRQSRVENCTWATLFEHRGSVYLMGTSAVFGHVVIYRTDDKGLTWTSGADENSGLLLRGGDSSSKTPPNYHTAPVPVMKHNGRIYRAYEDATAQGAANSSFCAFIISAPEDADLLKASSWTATNKVPFDASAIPAAYKVSSGSWLEGNVVVSPEGGIYDVLRTTLAGCSDKAVILKLSEDNKTLTLDKADAFITMPGASHKFDIHYDEVSQRYVTLINENTDLESFNQRNVLSLAYSEDLRNWTVAETVLADDSILSWKESIANIGYQYVSFLIDGDDIHMLVRQSTDGGANYHDANQITYYKINDFRRYFN